MHLVTDFQIQGRRNYQEDRCFSASTTIGNHTISLLAVADGMGGHSAGDIAATIAIDHIMKFWDELIHSWNRDSLKTLKKELRKTILAANQSIKSESERDSGASGMGTTLVCAIIIDEKLIVGNIGDSRAYLISHNAFTKITRDHSAIEEASSRGFDVTKTNVGSNAITRCLDGSEPCKADIYPAHKLCYKIDEKAVMLCSDGLHGSLELTYPTEYLELATSVEDFARIVVDEAYDKGSNDNISIAVCFPHSWKSKFGKRARQLISQQNDISTDMSGKNSMVRKTALAGIIVLTMLLLGIITLLVKPEMNFERDVDSSVQLTTDSTTVSKSKQQHINEQNSVGNTNPIDQPYLRLSITGIEEEQVGDTVLYTATLQLDYRDYGVDAGEEISEYNSELSLPVSMLVQLDKRLYTQTDFELQINELSGSLNSLKEKFSDSLNRLKEEFDVLQSTAETLKQSHETLNSITNSLTWSFVDENKPVVSLDGKSEDFSIQLLGFEDQDNCNNHDPGSLTINPDTTLELSAFTPDAADLSYWRMYLKLDDSLLPINNGCQIIQKDTLYNK